MGYRYRPTFEDAVANQRKPKVYVNKSRWKKFDLNWIKLAEKL